MTERKKIFVWTLFDFGNTSFSIVVVTFLYAVYFKKVVAGGEAIGDFYWSLGTSVAMIITAIISPILGAIADYSAGKKRFLLFFTLMSVIATASLFYVQSGMVFWGLLIFIIANVGFEAGLVFYDSFLPEITSPKNFGRVSGYGFGMGYVGSLVTLAIVYPFIQMEMIKETFPVAALFFLVFSLPLFIFLKDNRKSDVKEINYFKIGVSRVFNTITHLPKYKNLAIFLIAYFFYIEGVNTVIFFSGNYASTTLGFTDTELLIFFLTVQTTAIIGSILLGILADSIGQKRTIMITLVMWLGTIFLAYSVSDKETFYIVGLIAGAAMGASQSTSRSFMSHLTPIEKKTEFFGFYSFFGKSSAIIGPLVFGLISYYSGNQRLAIISIAFFFLVGLIILSFVKEERTPIQT
ncbi:MAG TPA: MFS transporter [Ignavibacteriaceae bacterium]|nr:MFS transporter [Ignavibacteriaceae bacterium]